MYVGQMKKKMDESRCLPFRQPADSTIRLENTNPDLFSGNVNDDPGVPQSSVSNYYTRFITREVLQEAAAFATVPTYPGPLYELFALQPVPVSASILPFECYL
jgi:hypothetical protein